jgi:5-methylcytosine-specific restriction endonuclease McrA
VKSRELTPEIVRCPQCNKAFYKRDKHRHARTHCSSYCASLTSSAKRRGSGRRAPCPRCGTSFIVWPPGVSHARKTCGCKPPKKQPRPYQLLTIKCLWCCREFKGNKTTRFCGQRCFKRNEISRKHLRRRGLIGQPTVALEVVYQRDRGVCQLCHRCVAPDRNRPKRDWPTVDHIIPLSKGGPHDYSNTQLAHFGCNSAKRDRGYKAGVPRPD